MYTIGHYITYGNIENREGKTSDFQLQIAMTSSIVN